MPYTLYMLAHKEMVTEAEELLHKMYPNVGFAHIETNAASRITFETGNNEIVQGIHKLYEISRPMSNNNSAKLIVQTRDTCIDFTFYNVNDKFTITIRYMFNNQSVNFSL